jgi:hypothetical protein
MGRSGTGWPAGSPGRRAARLAGPAPGNPEWSATVQDVAGETARRVRFTVGAVVRNCNGGGHLWVSPGTISLDFGRLTRRFTGIDRVVHRDPEVVVYETRLMPFWFNTHVVLRGGTQNALAAVPHWTRRRLLDELRSAGFEVKERRTWLRRGSRELRAEPS